MLSSELVKRFKHCLKTDEVRVKIWHFCALLLAAAARVA